MSTNLLKLENRVNNVPREFTDEDRKELIEVLSFYIYKVWEHRFHEDVTKEGIDNILKNVG
jgi:hypothetical protein